MNLLSPHERCLYTCRNINYWISDAEWPDAGAEEFFTEAVEVGRNFLYNICVICTQVSHMAKVFILHCIYQ